MPVKEEFYAEYFRIEDHHWWFVGRRRIFLAMLDRHLGPPPEGQPRQILDIGCGTGTTRNLPFGISLLALARRTKL